MTAIIVRTEDGRVDWKYYGLLTFYLGIYAGLLVGLSMLFWR